MRRLKARLTSRCDSPSERNLCKIPSQHLLQQKPIEQICKSFEDARTCSKLLEATGERDGERFKNGRISSWIFGKACKLCRPGEQFFPLSEFCYIKVLESWTKNNLEPSLVHQTSKKTNHSTSLHRMERGKKRKRKYYLLSHRKKRKKWTFFLSSFVATTTTRHLNLLGWFLCFRNVFSSLHLLESPTTLFSFSLYSVSGKRKLKIFLSSEIMNFHIVIPADVAVLLVQRRLVKRKKVFFLRSIVKSCWGYVVYVVSGGKRWGKMPK